MRKKKQKWQELQEAAQQNDATKATTAAASLKLGRKDEYYDACVTAIRHGAADALKALLEAGGGFNFSGKKYSAGYAFLPERSEHKEKTENQRLAALLVKEAHAAPAAGTLLPVLYKHSRMDRAGFLNERSPVELLEIYLKDKLFRPDASFSDCVEKTGLPAPVNDKLEFILSFAAERDSATLSKALITVAAKGDKDKAALLLSHGADANFDGAWALRSAADNEDQSMVDLLLPYVSLDTHGAKIITQLLHNNADPAVIESISAATKKAAQETVAEPVSSAAQDESRFQRVDGDTLAEKQTLPDGQTLTTLFNFTTRQQIVKWGDSAPTVVSFDALGEDVVNSMREKFDALANTVQTRPQPATAVEKAQRAKRLQRVMG